MLALRFFDQKQKSTKDLSQESASFFWFQLLIDVIKRMSRTKISSAAQEEMLQACEDYYRTNKCELQKIEHFRQTYVAKNALEWHTKDSFIYRLLNKGLRTDDIVGLFLFRFYIIDLCSQLEGESSRQKPFFHSSAPTLLYRAQRISNDELQKLKDNIRVLISTNGFLSTTRDRDLALVFVAGVADTEELKTVLFQITAKSNLTTVHFADITKYSHMKDEKEVLFSISAVFKVMNVAFDNTLKVWLIELVATDEGSNHVQDYFTLLKNELECTNPELLFGRLH
ncbi:unnamed protein product [Didymodactylos carnosus]|uniref:Uncharacterized protein n=1 Tax=Didymodactylos carnosus TaxID=1234261 RepID=A0A8S2K2K8_9BILA|nr:unnamed protein product [Didymodactylos carnosus]CAF3825894.1 unnamed protein product [Didymodactylos carnosus]